MAIDRVSHVNGLPRLRKFVSLHCTERKYSYQVKKCGDAACNICKPPNLPRDIFNQLKWIPDPIPDSDGLYKQFSSLYGTKTSEDHCTSLKQKSKRRKTLPFASSLRHVKNVDMMLQCEECNLWRLLYSKQRLLASEREKLEGIHDTS